MTYVLIIEPSVTREVRKIYSYRENDRPGSGLRFFTALNECYDRITENPFCCQLRKGDFRHVMLRKLKYRLVYRIHGATVYVVQVRHTSRKPSKRFGP